jgi:phosphate:Na+ symporter
MTDTVFQLLGGIGLFLLGMVLLTDGLKAFAGEALQQALTRFTGTPARAFASGTLVTLIVQSSTATTVTLIGFVSAGLIAFPQAVGVVMGASLGTTGTGWIVSVLGLKVSLGFYALPLVGVGALLRLLGTARWRALGLALAGFGLMFVGIETLQTGMQRLAGVFDLARLPAAGLAGHLAAMGIGIVLTLIMQSSTAAVATTLTALHAGAVNFEQAAALVIGAAVGTTATGALAAIGGSVPAKRTALAHVLFNLATGLIAIVLLPLLLWGLMLGQRHLGLEPGAVSLAAFHTLFIGLGVALFLPFAAPLARWIERLLPERGPSLTRHLDDTLLQAPPVALEATRRTLTDLALEVVDLLASALAGAGAADDAARRADAVAALDAVQRFFARIPAIGDDVPLSRARVSQLHAIDHLARLLPRLVPAPAVRTAFAGPPLQEAVASCRQLLGLARAALRGKAPEDWRTEAERLAQLITVIRRDARLHVLQQTAVGGRTPAEALALLDAVRWLERVASHVARASYYLVADGPVPADAGLAPLDAADE